MFNYNFHTVGGSHNFIPSLFGDLKLRKALVGSPLALLGVVLSALLGPAALVLVVILVTKPDGPLSADSNTLYWVLSSVMLGIAIIAGAAMLTWFVRLMVRLFTIAMAHFALQDYPEEIEALLDECEQDVIGDLEEHPRNRWLSDSTTRPSSR